MRHREDRWFPLATAAIRRRADSRLAHLNFPVRAKKFPVRFHREFALIIRNIGYFSTANGR